MGGESAEISLDGNPNIILLSGLQGSGKTTFAQNLALGVDFKNDKNRIPEIDILVENNQIWKEDNFQAKIYEG